MFFVTLEVYLTNLFCKSFCFFGTGQNRQRDRLMDRQTFLGKYYFTLLQTNYFGRFSFCSWSWYSFFSKYILYYRIHANKAPLLSRTQSWIEPHILTKMWLFLHQKQAKFEYNTTLKALKFYKTPAFYWYDFCNFEVRVKTEEA